jgi:predicted  nucleic acid-binding Zn-ribbon protein
MKTMSEETKRQIRDLMRQKISLEDQLQIATDDRRIQRLEDDLYEVKDTLDKLTNGVWFEDVSEHELQKERESIN